MPLDQFEEHRRPILHRLGEDLQQVALLVPVGENPQLPQRVQRHPGVPDPLAQGVVVTVGAGQEFHSRSGHAAAPTMSFVANATCCTPGPPQNSNYSSICERRLPTAGSFSGNLTLPDPSATTLDINAE